MLTAPVFVRGLLAQLLLFSYQLGSDASSAGTFSLPERKNARRGNGGRSITGLRDRPAASRRGHGVVTGAAGVVSQYGVVP